MVTEHKIDKLAGPSGTFAGYSLLIFGLIWSYFNLAGIVFIIAGMFMAFTFDGTLIDFNSRRIKSYICIFGLLKIGQWHNVNEFSKFRIYKSRRSYTAYSRGNIPLTIKNSDIRLVFANNSGTLRITINKYSSFEAAKKEMTELIRELQITRLDEWGV